MVYDGGILTPADIEAIVVPASELAGLRFIAPDQVAGMVTPLVARRIAASLDAVAAGTVASLDNGTPTG
jgi:8-oxo-dGTP diphosphatase